MRSWSSSLRKWAAILIATTLAWDYYRDISTFTSFSIWSLIIHFIYFQLPQKSKALAYLHSISFISAFCIPVMYIYMIITKPFLEQEHMEVWSMGPRAVMVTIRNLISLGGW
jgi:hypothetical protein